MKYLSLLILLAAAYTGYAQPLTKRVVFFTDKNGTAFSLSNPGAYLSSRAVERRTRYSISIDSTDLPVLQRYIDSVRLSGTVTILGRSKWLNAVVIQTTDANALTRINAFPFVRTVQSIALRTAPQPRPNKFPDEAAATMPIATEPAARVLADTFNYGSSANQIRIHKGQLLHNLGARGQGMRMAFFDAGFTGFQTNRFFDSARARNQFLGTWDFVSGNSNVNEDHPHGLNCFSIVGGYIPGTFVGSCPEAGYYLLRTEDAPTEQIIEEYNWVLGAEYADSAGVDVISSSLGYSTFDQPAFDHSYADLNGNTTVITRMADLAAKKGMLVVNSAGNEGNSSWRFILAPADGDSVLSVGAVNSSGLIASFSSFGPTSDGRVKPDVVSVGAGTALISTGGNVTNSSGTSFSCPNLAGLATCLWQLFPEVNNYTLITTLRNASDRINTPHPQYGYGLPDLRKAVADLLAQVSGMNVVVNNCTATINWNSKDKTGMMYRIERRLPGQSGYTVVATVPAASGAFAARSYQQFNSITNAAAGTVTYRISQLIDPDNDPNTYSLLDSVSITLPAACSTSAIVDRDALEQSVSVYPNPAADQLTIRFKETAMLQQLTLQLFNLQQQLVLEQNFQKPAGAMQHQLYIGAVPKGTYLLVILHKGKRYAVKELIKQ